MVRGRHLLSTFGCLALILLLASCSKNETEPTSTSDAMFTLIEWPPKYEGDGGDLSSEQFRVDVMKFAELPSAFCWATYSHRQTADDAETDPFATQAEEVTASGMLWFTVPYYELGQKALDGVYTIRVGLCASDSSYLFEPKGRLRSKSTTSMLAPSAIGTMSSSSTFGREMDSRTMTFSMEWTGKT